MNLCEAIESGKRYNRAIRMLGWGESQYLYEKQVGDLPFLLQGNTENQEQPDEGFQLTSDELCGRWELSHAAPWYGPAGMITKERIEQAVRECCENELGFADSPDSSFPKLIPNLTNLFFSLANGTIAFTEQSKEDQVVLRLNKEQVETLLECIGVAQAETNDREEIDKLYALVEKEQTNA